MLMIHMLGDEYGHLNVILAHNILHLIQLLIFWLGLFFLWSDIKDFAALTLTCSGISQVPCIYIAW